MKSENREEAVTTDDHAKHVRFSHFDGNHASLEDARRYLKQLTAGCEDCMHDYYSTPVREVMLIRVALLVEPEKGILHPILPQLEAFASGKLWLRPEAKDPTKMTAVQVAKHVAHCAGCLEFLVTDDMFVKKQIEAKDRDAKMLSSVLLKVKKALNIM